MKIWKVKEIIGYIESDGMKKVIVTVEMTDNNYSAYIKQLQGCVSTGKTFEELKKNITEAIEFHLEGMNEDGEEIPFDMDYELIYRFDPVEQELMAVEL